MVRDLSSLLTRLTLRFWPIPLVIVILFTVASFVFLDFKEWRKTSIVLGVGTCLVSTLVFLPGFLQFLENRQEERRRGTP